MNGVGVEVMKWIESSHQIHCNFFSFGTNLLEFFLITISRPSFMDPDYFGFATSGTLIVSWAGVSMRPSVEPPTGFGGSTVETPFSSVGPTGGRRTHRTSQGLFVGEGVR